MALVRCGECGRQISDKAPACPQCGCPKPPTMSESLSSAGGSMISAGCSLMMLSMLVLFVLGLCL